MDSTFLPPTTGDEIEKAEETGATVETVVTDKVEEAEPVEEIEAVEEAVTADGSAEPEEKPAAPLAEITFGPDPDGEPVITSTADPSPVADPIGQVPSAPVGRPMAAVACYGLTKRYGSAPALSDVSLELPAGKIIGLLGPNGSGKTTFIKILAGLLKPTAGAVLIHGEEPGVRTKAMVSYLPERMVFDPGMRVSDCIELFRDFYGDFDERRAREMLSVLGVPVDGKLKTFSKGTREKVQLVLVMARRAKLYLLDEPIGGVDPAARDFILHTIVTAYEPGATVILSTHLIRDVEPILDGFVFLGSGSVIMSGDAETVRADTGKSLDELFREVFRCW